MLKRWFVLIIAFTFLLAVSSVALGLEPFPLKEYVTDQAGILSETQRSQIAKELWDYDQATGNQVLVVAIPSLEDEELVDYTEKLFTLNQPGQKGKDNGLILLIAVKEHKIRIETGYGLEELLPDGKGGTIIRDQIGPYFKNNDYYGGITAGVASIMGAITPGYTGARPSTAAPVRSKKDTAFPAAFLVALLLGGFSFLGNRNHNLTQRRYSRGYSEPSYWGGSGFGGGSSGGSSGGGFSGGGGSFGGGGASGGW